MKRNRLFSERLESRCMLTAVTFVEVSIEGVGDDINAADFDTDGDLDIIVRDGHTLTLYENTNDGEIRNAQQLNFPHTRHRFEDFDGDGDLDLLGVNGVFFFGAFSWYENIDGFGEFGSEIRISGTCCNFYGEGFVMAADAGDINGDGALDVVLGRMKAGGLHNIPFHGNLVWFENGPEYFDRHVQVDYSRRGALLIFGFRRRNRNPGSL